MKKIIIRYSPDLLLFAVTLFYGLLLVSCYPSPQLSWDSFDYIVSGMNHSAGLRPGGYGVFLHMLYMINKSLHFVTWLQLSLFFAAVLFLLKTIRTWADLSKGWYILLGLLLLSDPVSLYHSNTILSDLLFQSLTLFCLACLLHYLQGQQYWYLLLHVVFMFAAIEVRHIALFYPFFSIMVLLVFSPRRKVAAVYALLLCGISYLLYQYHVHDHERKFGVRIYSAFGAWNQANNSLYALPRISMDTRYIEDPEIRRLQQFFSAYMQDSSFIVYQVGSAYLWEERSPLNAIRRRLQDSCGLDFNTAWYRCAPAFGKYGTYIQTHFPYEYWMSYVIPNLKSLWRPQYGEMADFEIAAAAADPEVLKHYRLHARDRQASKQVYRDHINHYIGLWYTIIWIMFSFSCCLFLIFRKRITVLLRSGLGILIAFVLLYGALNLYASWFLYRYLMPVTPLMIIVSFVVILQYLRQYKDRSKSSKRFLSHP